MYECMYLFIPNRQIAFNRRLRRALLQNINGNAIKRIEMCLKYNYELKCTTIPDNKLKLFH